MFLMRLYNMSKKQSSIQKESDKLSMKQKLYFAFSAKVNQLAALILLIPGLPIMLFLIILVHITSPGPAIYKQRRVGKDGKVFNLMKRLKTTRALPVWAEFFVRCILTSFLSCLTSFLDRWL